MIKKYVITNTKNGKSYKADMLTEDAYGELQFPTEASMDAWFNKKVANKTFGLPERDYIYKIEYYKTTPGGNDILHLTKDFPLDPEYDDDILTMGEVMEDRPGGKQKRFIYRLKAEYTVETSDIEADIQAEEQAKADAETAKQECCERLASIDWASKTTIASLKPILQDLISHLGIEPSE